MTLREKIGQKLMAGLPGLEITDEFRALVREHKVGNVILFKWNMRDREQVKRLCADIQALVTAETGHPALIAVDQEGGCVTRLPEDCANVPGQMALAAAGGPEMAEQAALLTAGELRALGINFDLAPVADVNSNPDNPIIGARSFGDSPETVAAYACAALRGYARGGVLSAAKHFPGHGDAAQDSHVSLPSVDKTLDELEQTELIPFRAMIEAGCPAVLTAHILFPRLEPGSIPATMSRRIVTGLLRGWLEFDGLVLTDCMEMDAIGRYYGTVAGCVQAMTAGVDIVLCSHTNALAAQAAQAMEDKARSGSLSLMELDASVERILRAKERYALPPAGQAGSTEAMAAADRLREGSIALLSGTIPPLGDRPLFVGCADYRAGLVSNLAGDAPSFAAYMARELGGTALVTAKDPDSGQIAAAVKAAAGASAVIVNTYNGHLFPGQLALVRALGETGLPMAAVALRDPYDLRAVPARAAAIAAWDYSPMTLRALAPVLAGRRPASGRVPVKLN